MESKVLITLNIGLIGTTEVQKKTVAALGLRYRGASRVLNETPSVRGMIDAVRHLVSREKVSETLVIPSPFGGAPEYQLGPVPEKKEPEKKKKSPSLTSASESAEEGKAGKKAAGTKKEGRGKATSKGSAKAGQKSGTPSHKKAKSS